MFEQCGSDEKLDADDGRRTNSLRVCGWSPRLLRSRTVC
jgi:hypothetical protein